MVTNSRYLMTGSSTRCAFSQPFRVRDGYVEYKDRQKTGESSTKASTAPGGDGRIR
jgi:hypothetical protein